MTDSNLVEFITERVYPSGRQLMTIDFAPSETEPQTGLMLATDGMAVVILPTIADNVLHLETHYFVDNLRVAPETIIPDAPNACVEHTLRRPDAVT